MAFSKKYLLKYGWKEGEGLGKNSDGLKTAIKPKLKFDKAGVGYNPSLEFCDQWWKNVYSEALKNISSIQEKVEVHAILKSAQGILSCEGPNTGVVICSERQAAIKALIAPRITSMLVWEYQSLLNQLAKRIQEEPLTQSDESKKKKKKKRKCNEEKYVNSCDIKTHCEKQKRELLDEDDLFQACNGRTAHKGARHGLQLSGKLLRLEEQERTLVPENAKYISSKENNKFLVSQELSETTFKSEKITEKKLKKRNSHSSPNEFDSSHKDNYSEAICERKKKRSCKEKDM